MSGFETTPLPDRVHPCTRTGCKNIVSYDDEPFCYDHSPDSGSSVVGYSYRASRRGDKYATLTVTVRLDPVEGTFSTVESVQEQVQGMLNQMIPHYNPTVLIAKEQ